MWPCPALQGQQLPVRSAPVDIIEIAVQVTGHLTLEEECLKAET